MAEAASKRLKTKAQCHRREILRRAAARQFPDASLHSSLLKRTAVKGTAAPSRHSVKGLEVLESRWL